MLELSEHVLDLIYNSIEAGARRVEVCVTEDTREDRLFIEIRDDGRGMSAEQAQQALDPFFTTRTTRKVGLGLPLLAENARACDGGVKIESEPGRGTTVSVSFRHSHVDRQPLGDMATTLMVALTGTPDVEIAYRHEVDGRVFAFDSRGIREAAGGLAPSHPAVRRWLQGFLAEGFAGLHIKEG